MQLKATTALCFGLVLSAAFVAPADAQTRQQRPVDGTTYTERGEDGRVRTKVVIQKRSFLDGGTEVLPGSKPTQTEAMPYGYSPLAIVEGTNAGGIRSPLPGPYDGLGRNGPF